MQTLQPRTLYVDLDNPQHAYVYEELKAHPNSTHPRGFILVHIDGALGATSFDTHYLEPGENLRASLTSTLPENLVHVWEPGTSV